MNSTFNCWAFVTLLFVFGCISFTPSNDSVMQKVFFQTSDGVKSAANFWPAASSKAVILVHQFNNSKDSCSRLAGLLNQNGFGVLAIDLRGHGESKATGSLSSPASLTPSDFQDMNLDLLAAQNFLKQKNFNEFYLVGASIGANLAIIFPSQNPGFKAVVALSPGEDFKSLQPLSSAKKTTVPTLIVASAEDSYSFETSQELDSVFSAEHELLALQNSGHGTFMLTAKPELNQKILDFFKAH